MKLQKGTTFGPYRIEDSLGAGGMGEVYRARDTRLDRRVAIKVIPPHLASRSDVRERFEREARVISSLNHPNICVLHDVGEETIAPAPGGSSEPVQYIVMELLQGETLEERIRRGRLPTSEAVAIAIQIARALEHAHAHGVVHRDLKPSNVMLTSAGVKILDFGLSKMLRQSEEEILADRSETVHKAITEEGVILGTLQYMAPEQAEGKPADARTDIFALGAILYEMLTGRRAFEGKSRASLIAAIMAIDPPEVTAMRPEAPPALERVIETCLAKNPDDRWQSPHDVRMALEMATVRGGTIDGRDTSRWRTAIPWILAALATLAAVALALRPREEADRSPVVFELVPAELQYAWGGAPAQLSPDGKRVLAGLWSPGSDGAEALYVRDLDSLEFRKLGPEGMIYDAVWSWDGESVLFFNDFEMKTVSAGGGPVRTLASAGDSRGAAWGPGGMILFVPELTEGVHLIDAAGGEPRRITTVDREAGEIAHVRPRFLPDGRHFLFLVHSNDSARRGIYVGDIEGSPHRFLIGSQGAPVFAAPDRVLYHHDGDLYAQTLDMDRIVPVGSPRLVARDVTYNAQFDNPGYSASRNGVLSWHRGVGGGEPPVYVHDRSGETIGTSAMAGSNLDISRNDGKLAVQRDSGEGPRHLGLGAGAWGRDARHERELR